MITISEPKYSSSSCFCCRKHEKYKQITFRPESAHGYIIVLCISCLEELKSKIADELSPLSIEKLNRIFSDVIEGDFAL